MPLHTLEGPAFQFVKLQAALRERQREERARHALEDVHQQLARVGILQAERLQEKIGEYLDGTDIQVIEDFDEHLLAGHGILMEDLPLERLQQFLENPSIFEKGSRTVDEIRKQLYGRGRMPILAAEAQAEACVHHEVSRRRREFAIEHIAETSALREFLEEQKIHAGAGRGALTGGTKRLWLPWVNAMTTVLSDGEAVQRKGAGSKTFLALTTLGLEPELLAIITCQNVLNLLMLPCFRNKDEMQENARHNRFGEVPFATAATRVGEAVEDELMWQRIAAHESGHGTKSEGAMKPELLEMRRLRQAFRNRTQSVPIGAALVDLLIDCSALRVPGMHIDSKVVSDGPAAKIHEVVGYLSLHPLARARMESEGDMLHFIKPKMQPMVIPPLPWQPCGDSPQGPYILHKSGFVRTTSEQMTQLRSYSASRSAGVMDFLGRVPWRINGRILDLIREARQRGLAIGGIPPNEDPPVPDVPDESDPDYQVLRLRRLNAERRCRELRSERPTFELKLRSAEDFVNAEKLYFPHNVDFRGRCYPLPPHLNHMGDDVSRALLMFSESKPLGSEGLFWSKVSVANLHGKNKISLEDRVRWVDDRKDIILQVAKDPFSPESIEHWADADDGPWQVLARYLELAEVYSRPGLEEEFRSHLPVHVDGSCNGLQHYAALGRDLAGGEAVNLLPNDKPQDVYTVVLKIVIDKVNADAALPVHVQTESPEGRPPSQDQGHLARRLLELGILQRKVVKQTIMTICYGVTAVGARKQVQGQIEDMVGEKVDPDEILALAKYLSRLVLASIDDVFAQAMKIQNWLNQITKIFSKLQAPNAWISPVGLNCVQPYRNAQKAVVRSKRQTVTLKTGDAPTINQMRQRMGYPPNFIHSLDASHMMMVAESCQREGMTFAAVHDSFWTHACDTAKLNMLTREAFVELHRQPILAELYEDMKVHLGGQAPPPLPEQGQLDLDRVRDSLYFFA
ncbi:RPOT2 [Symbiodinium necroappetens]|uniref:DNA-directed RNA polymerase n=1 Tax=Symbiodinium necroappetens TaxID=1628268 RepID=A0A813CAA0_9DINO|nr:RPOT2 [Symbiodinium necroappetens]